MEVFLNIMTCIFEVTIFELFFRGLLRRRYSSPIFYIAIYIGVVSLIYGINSLGNSKLNLIANILIYYAAYSLLYEEELKERVEYFKSQNKLIEAQRIEERTNFDIEMLI